MGSAHTELGALLAELATVRERGYSIDREEAVVGIAGFGFALRYGSPSTDAISCSAPVVRLGEERGARIVVATQQQLGIPDRGFIVTVWLPSGTAQIAASRASGDRPAIRPPVRGWM